MVLEYCELGTLDEHVTSIRGKHGRQVCEVYKLDAVSGGFIPLHYCPTHNHLAGTKHTSVYSLRNCIVLYSFGFQVVQTTQ